MDLLDLPVEALAVLHPFEIGDGHTARVGQDVGQNHDALLLKDGISLRGHRAVGEFEHDPRLDAVGIGDVDHVLQRRRHQDVAVDAHQRLAVEQFMAAMAGGRDHRTSAVLGREEALDVEPAGRLHRTFRIRHGDNLVAVGGEKAGNVLAGIAEPLHGDAQAALKPQVVGEMADQIVAAARCGIAAAERTAQRQRLAGDDGGRGLADDLAVFVGHPAHDHRVGVDVGRRNVAVRADDAGEGLDVGTGQALEFCLRQLARVDLHRTLAAAIGQVHDSAFEGHPEGQHLDLVGGRFRMEANAALGRSTGVVIAAAPRQEGFSRAVVHADHQTRLGRLAGKLQFLDHVCVDVQMFCRLVEAHECMIKKTAFCHNEYVLS